MRVAWGACAEWRSVRLLLLVVGGLAAGCKQPIEAPKKSVPRVTVGHPIARELTDEVEFGGWVAPVATLEVRARVRGHIDKVHFKDGDMVTKGQVLFSLDPRPFQAQIDQSKAQIQAFAAQKLAAEKDVARYTALVQSGGATKQQLEKSEADVKVYDAQIAAQTEVMREQQLNLEFAEVTSTIDGRIGRAMMTEGNLVNAGGSDQLLATVVTVDPVYVYFNVDERTLQRWQKLRAASGETEADSPKTLRERKLPFRFALDADEDFPNEGLLDFADNQFDATTGTIQVRGRVTNPDGKFVSGQRAKVRVALGKPYQALVVPETAVLSDQEKRYLLVLGPDNVVIRRDVTPGRLLDDGMRVVRSATDEALGTNDWIITQGLQRARLNDPVEPIDADGKPAGGKAGGTAGGTAGSGSTNGGQPDGGAGSAPKSP